MEDDNGFSNRKARILIVDDRPENLLALEATLAPLGHDIMKADSGREALRLVLENDFALILLDAHMGGVDGFETATLIRSREKSQHVPIIFLTAMYKNTSQVFKGYLSGAVDYIFKPFVPEILRAKVGVFVDLYNRTMEASERATLLDAERRELDEANKTITCLYGEIEKNNEELKGRIEERTARLARANEALRAEVAERKRAEEERARLLILEKEAREQAQAANRAKDQFLATVSHELRTPLNAMLGWLRLLRSGRLDAESIDHALETIERNAKTQARLIEDILDVSRITSGKVRLELRRVELPTIVGAAIDSVRPAAQSKEITLEEKLDFSTGEITCDPARFQQIISNLLSNAVKFTPNGGKVGVELSEGEGVVRIVVRDTGIGIGADFLPYVFERFRQQETSITRKHGGLGLGLAIARHLTEMHSGTISADSPGPGLGSSFTVEIPLAPSIEVGIPKSAETQSVFPAEEGSFGITKLDGLRVLIVDDDRDTLGMLGIALSECGAEVKSANSASDAIKEMEDWKPQLLISDIGMPDEDGFSLIKRVRALGSDIPAIALTAFAGEDDRRRVLSSGFQLHISKPVDPAELIRSIASLGGGSS